MILEHTRKVTLKNGPRPAGKPDECFYCQQPIGADHKPECVLRTRVVLMAVEIIIPQIVPESWTADEIEHHINASSWCANNFLHDLADYIDTMDGCLCGSLKGTYLREASVEDTHGAHGLRN